MYTRNQFDIAKIISEICAQNDMKIAKINDENGPKSTWCHPKSARSKEQKFRMLESNGENRKSTLKQHKINGYW